MSKVPVWGDAQRLEQVSSGLKREGGTYGALVQRNAPGRPSGGETPSQQPQVAPEQVSLYDRLAQAELTRQQWDALAKASPTPWILGMRDVAEETYNNLAVQVYGATDNFED